MYQAIILALLLAGCASQSEPPRVSPASPRVQAALASVTVTNHTGDALTISFRDVGRARGIVSIGSVPAGATRPLAPVPAAEPIVLSARRADGAGLELPVRTFALDETWTWVIPADAVFR